ncbi:MAG: 50S ribosomal protein L15 [Candidatus Scalindua sp. AMX11]|nr:MAG: 50S ribosomal protein L15 [Candidatus Scalindua sp.]NOG85505.1 50S ribosomal protein L15 [Planctomycetota bacterium]RZV90246.1 MAG: 50S ribosomal protein L15 [Candidatus Scalindua sp. SCAELEC01]TDE64657.1 MAG: 50S ribosomal protein L15 [Candidatus Scalindua sp. AMX11]GJQ57506.1 MAG: 50S ribosomal protein L15 [Candidatus Scalindua sp.]
MNLVDSKTITHKRLKRKRVGRGRGSGCGKTCSKGHGGANSRSGTETRLLFEGGQMPLFRRIPKRGFDNKRFQKKYQAINLADLAGFEEGATVDVQSLKDKGILKNTKIEIKILGKVHNDKPLNALTVVAKHFSKSAISKIQEAGGKVTILS